MGATPVTISVTTITTTTITTINTIWNHIGPSLHFALKHENPDPRSLVAHCVVLQSLPRGHLHGNATRSAGTRPPADGDTAHSNECMGWRLGRAAPSCRARSLGPDGADRHFATWARCHTIARGSCAPTCLAPPNRRLVCRVVATALGGDRDTQASASAQPRPRFRTLGRHRLGRPQAATSRCHCWRRMSRPRPGWGRYGGMRKDTVALRLAPSNVNVEGSRWNSAPSELRPYRSRSSRIEAPALPPGKLVVRTRRGLRRWETSHGGSRARKSTRRQESCGRRR